MGFGIVWLIRRRLANRPDPRREREQEYARLLAAPEAADLLLGLERLLRQTLADTLGPRAFSVTTRELLTCLEEMARPTPADPPLPWEPMRAFLHAVEACKFAGTAIDADQARQFLVDLKPWLLRGRRPPTS